MAYKFREKSPPSETEKNISLLEARREFIDAAYAGEKLKREGNLRKYAKLAM
jgi:hypothetical protein